MSEHDNLRIAREAMAAINAHDIDGYLKHIDQSYVGESETLGVIHGPEGARQMLTTMFQAFPDLRFQEEQLIASGDHVVGRAILSGTQRGAFAGIAPTNKPVSWHICTIIEIRNGKAVRGRTYADNVTLLRQLGALPASKATTAS